MRQSHLFGKTLREPPKDEVAKNAIFLERGGFVYKTMAGVYDYLPLGFRVLEKVNRIIREEMNGIGGQELLLSAFQPKERWMKTGRWSSMADIMYQFRDHSARELGLGATHEEALAEIATRSIFSYRDLPLLVYQIQTKFRDEPRAKSGLMRGREFLMKDLYSFHADEKGLEEFYWKADAAYKKVFSRAGLKFYVTEASGGTFTKEFTHEYQVIAEAGEDWTMYCESCGYAQNKEVSSLKAGDSCPKCKGKIQLARSIEVGNIFKLGTKFSDAFGLLYSDETGKKLPVWMGSYGIGPGRLMATIVEVSNDEKGIIWPEAVAPFRVHLIALPGKEEKSASAVLKAAESLYEGLAKKGVEVLYDDRVEKTAGERFADADLIGIPYRVVISEKTLEKKSVEVKERAKPQVRLMTASACIKMLTK